MFKIQKNPMRQVLLLSSFFDEEMEGEKGK